jgi:hypothetical protein
LLSQIRKSILFPCIIGIDISLTHLETYPAVL